MATGLERGARHARTALLLALGACLSACLAAQPAPPAPPAAARAEAAPADTLVPPPHPDKKPLVAALPPARETPPGPERLQGLDETETIAMLGEPQQRADAPPARLWRYASRGCELDLYFYLDLQSRAMRILHYDLRVTDGSKRSQQGCWGEIAAARHADQIQSADRPR